MNWDRVQRWILAVEEAAFRAALVLAALAAARFLWILAGAVS